MFIARSRLQNAKALKERYDYFAPSELGFKIEGLSYKHFVPNGTNAVFIALGSKRGGIFYPRFPGLISRPVNLRVHRMPLRRLLERERDAQRRGFVIQPPGEHDRTRQARRAGEAARDADCRMPSHVRDDQAGAAGCGRDKDVPLRHQLVHVAHQ